MAFATANVSADAWGQKKITVGDWTGTEGDADGTLTVSGGRVYGAAFSIQDPGSPTEHVQWQAAVASGSTTAITIHNHQTVTRGRFYIIHS